MGGGGRQGGGRDQGDIRAAGRGTARPPRPPRAGAQRMPRHRVQRWRGASSSSGGGRGGTRRTLSISTSCWAAASTRSTGRVTFCSSPSRASLRQGTGQARGDARLQQKRTGHHGDWSPCAGQGQPACRQGSENDRAHCRPKKRRWAGRTAAAAATGWGGGSRSQVGAVDAGSAPLSAERRQHRQVAPLAARNRLTQLLGGPHAKKACMLSD